MIALNPARLLATPTCYHYLRQVLTGGMPFRSWVDLYGLSSPEQRVADLGCGPADILRYVKADRRPAFYLGVDVSGRYLDAARRRAARAGVPADFVQMDLSRAAIDLPFREALVRLLEQHRITRVLLLGVLHHVDDEAALRTLDLVASASGVRSLVTIDVVYLPNERVNNWLCARDRGRHVRDEAGYDALAARCAWPRHRKFWTSPNLRFIKYLHYDFSK